ncbi:hypothetical protein ACN4EG_21200 [Alkalinema pantanalense CENA528]|uniref:hypothetical protein n=1 Tax=Alkalinema pantanalense TaxID=1620705 RepID=UPI003D6FBA6C
MAITRRPKATTPEDFIEKGGSVANVPISPTIAVVEEKAEGKRGRPPKEKEEESGVKLRLPLSLLQRIDAAVESRKPSPSRHQWILEAIYEKLDRDIEA